MGSKGGDAQSEVNDYYMSMHIGVAHNVDVVARIFYGEKMFWNGYANTNTRLIVSKRGLHGGNKKEGGVAGSIDVLLGGTSQVLPDYLANKLGKNTGNDCPGFRGITSLFFSSDSGGAGFYWSSNTPYLKPVWVTVIRAPKGLTSEIALVDGSYAQGTIGDGLLCHFEQTSGSDVVSQLGPNMDMNGDAALSMIDPMMGASCGTVGTGTFTAQGITGGMAGSSWRVEGFFFVKQPPFDGAATDIFEMSGANQTGFPPYFRLQAFGAFGSAFICDYDTDVSSGSGFYGLISTSPIFEQWNHIAVQFNMATGVTAIYCNGKFSGNLFTNPNEWGPLGFTNARIMSKRCDEFYFRKITAVELYSNTYVIPAVPFDRSNVYIDEFTPYNANPAHIIYECLTNSDWGMGESSDLIDVQSFEDCASVLFGEVFGLSLVWTRQSTIEEFTNEVLKHINGVVFTNPRTGLHTLRLIRGGYEESTLRNVNPDNASMSKFSRRVWGETTNEIVVTWTNPNTENEETVSLQDLGNISMQGAVISSSRNYYGVRTKELAMRLAARELRVAASPLCTCDVVLDRSAWDILPADVVTITWPEYGIAGIPMRVGTVDYGRIGDSKIKVTLIEDVFALPTTYFESPPTTEWTEGSTTPVPVVEAKVITLPAYASAPLVAGGLPALSYPAAFAGILAQAPNTASHSFELTGQGVDTLGNTTWVQKGTLSFTSSGNLAGPLAAQSTSLIPSFTDIIGAGATVAGFGFIGDGTDAQNEIVLFSGFTTSEGYTVKRGVLDTVPRDWPSGTKVWFVDVASLAYDKTSLSAGVSPQYRLLTNTGGGQLSISEAPIITGTISERPHLPVRPANFKIGAVGFGDFNAISLDAVTLTWANRNRISEETIVLGWTDGDTPGETGQTTTVVVATDAGVTLTTITGLTGTSHVLNLTPYATNEIVRVKAYAEREGLLSLQAHEIRIINIGVLRGTSGGDVRVIHTGEARYPRVA